MTSIFDIGSNNGDDIPYYLLKADRVIAFEANPVLCRKIESRFSTEVEAGRLVVENGIVLTDEDARTASAQFYIHKHNDVLSQFPRPPETEMHAFEEVELPIKTLSSAIKKYGTPSYAKIDIEHYDHAILAEFFRLECYPKYISSECHSPKVVSLLLECPEYTGFKLVDGESVSRVYRKTSVRNRKGEDVKISFPFHSAGPFGEDISGPWYGRNSMFRLLSTRDLGWKDLHASSVDRGVEVPVPFEAREFELLRNMEGVGSFERLQQENQNLLKQREQLGEEITHLRGENSRLNRKTEELVVENRRIESEKQHARKYPWKHFRTAWKLRAKSK